MRRDRKYTLKAAYPLKHARKHDPKVYGVLGYADDSGGTFWRRPGHVNTRDHLWYGLSQDQAKYRARKLRGLKLQGLEVSVRKEEW